MKFFYVFWALFLTVLRSGFCQDTDFTDSLKTILKRDPENLAVINDLAYEYTYTDLDSARTLLLYALDVNEGDSLQMGISIETLAIVDEIQGNIRAAISHHFESIEIFELIDSPKHLAWAYNGMGALHYQQYDYEQALAYFLRSKRIREELNDPVEVAKSMVNIALIFNKTEQFDSSLLYLKLSLRPFVGNEDLLMESIVYLNLGSTYSYMGELDSAGLYFNKAEEIQKQIGDTEGLGVLYRKLGELYSEKKQPETALEYYELSLGYARELGDIGRYIETRRAQYLVYESIGDYENAYRIQADYLILRDSLINISNKEIINEYNAKYESELRERTIAELELDQKNASLALANSNNQRNIFIFGFVIIMIGSGFLYYRYFNKKKTSDLLAVKNAQITASLEERETLLKEIHHRVKNNLQVISSLLKLQAGSLEDEAAVDAVKEGQHRVKSMALIHQKLYSAEDIRGVDVQDYFENLIDELKQAFGATEVRSEVNTSGLKMDIDTVIPLGLIMNELITNAFKYAFDDLENGRLDLSIVEGGDQLMVILKDNGKGLDQSTIEASNSFGWKMIRSLSRKLKAEIEVVNNQGTTITLSLSRYKLVS